MKENIRRERHTHLFKVSSNLDIHIGRQTEKCHVKTTPIVILCLYFFYNFAHVLIQSCVLTRLCSYQVLCFLLSRPLSCHKEISVHTAISCVITQMRLGRKLCRIFSEQRLKLVHFYYYYFYSMCNSKVHYKIS